MVYVRINGINNSILRNLELEPARDRHRTRMAVDRQMDEVSLGRFPIVLLKTLRQAVRQRKGKTGKDKDQGRDQGLDDNNSIR
jgi:hypothetical protein